MEERAPRALTRKSFGFDFLHLHFEFQDSFVAFGGSGLKGDGLVFVVGLEDIDEFSSLCFSERGEEVQDGELLGGIQR